MLIGCAAPQLSLPLTRAQRSDIDSNMAPLPHSLTSRRSAGGCENVIGGGWKAGGETQATKEAAVTAWTLVLGGRLGVEPAGQSAIDLCGFGGPCLRGHLPQMTDY